MLYQLSPELREINLDSYSPDQLIAGYITASELEACKEHFGLSESAVRECFADKDNYRNTVDVYDDQLFAILNIVDAHDVFQHSDRVAFFIKHNLLLACSLYDSDNSTESLFLSAIKRFKPEVTSMEKLIYALLEGTINDDAQALAEVEFEISRMEGDVIARHVADDFDTEIYEKKRELLILRNYYEQLIDIGECLEENEIDMFEEGALHYFSVFTAKAERLSSNVQMLRDSLTQLRDAHQSLMDYNLNRIMKILTIVTVIFMPLTLLVGWYGMNFTHMPELTSQYGYLGVIIASVIIVVISILWFRRKKML